MKAIMVMFDSLNRRMLEPYGCDWIHTPNFSRLAKRSVKFTNSFVGSMPCMPARRELHTGRYNFLHRSWGPIEPFDDSMPEILKNNKIHTHLISDHYHYWEDGGCTYHTRYSSWEAVRGQEGDPWKADLTDAVSIPEKIVDNPNAKPYMRQDWVNRGYMNEEKDFCQNRTFKLGMDFIEKNHEADNWFLTIETFDPHEPFFSPQRLKDKYEKDYTGAFFDWPAYAPVKETPEEVNHCRLQYASLVSMCDENLGRILDMMDKHDLWDDTMLIVNTDHGFLLGEHESWAKCWLPFYNEIANTPLFIWDPRTKDSGVCESLVQTIDLAPTLLEFFNTEIPEDMEGEPLKTTYSEGREIRSAALFGLHGAHVNCTDGNYVYMRGPVNSDSSPLYEYTHMATHMRHSFGIDELQNIEIAEPFTFTKGCQTMKVKGRPWRDYSKYGNLLFDIKNNPSQLNPITDEKIEKYMIEHILGLMKKNDAPSEQYQRLGLENV
ncbi:MAG: sulfatase [Sedimentisphaeraceae bacterium JB056]